MRIDATLTNGRAHVNTMDLVVDHDDVRIWELDFRSKRPFPSVAYATDGDGTCYTEVTFFAVTQEFIDSLSGDAGLSVTLHQDETTDVQTRVELRPDDGWSTVVEGGRYSYTIISWRRQP